MPSYQEGRSGRWPNSRTTTRRGRTFSICNSRSSWPSSSAAHAQIDWRAGYEFLDKELQKITLDAALGRRMVDKLVRVQLQDGREQWVLVHVEVQMQPAIGFPERMFVYHYRIHNSFGARSATFEILADDDPAWRPGELRDELLGTELVMRFSTAKLMDYEADWPALENENNPFAVVVMAHTAHRATATDPHARLDWKFRLTRRLFERGYDRQQIIGLYRFIDWVMALPDDLELEYDRQVDEYQEDRKMEYLSSMERRAMERGRQAGILEGVQQGMGKGAEGMQKACSKVCSKASYPDGLPRCSVSWRGV